MTDPTAWNRAHARLALNLALEGCCPDPTTAHAALAAGLARDLVESVVRHDAVLTCRSCGTRWGVRAPWPLDKRQRERGQLWMQRHTDSRQRACQGFWFDLQDLQEVRVG